MKLPHLHCVFPLLLALCGAQGHVSAAQEPAEGEPGTLIRVSPPDEPGVRPSGAVPESLRVTLTPEQMREDVAELKAGLEEYCAGLYRYVSKEELERAFEELDAKLNSELPLLAFHHELMKTLDRLRHQRVAVLMPTYLTSRTFGKESNVLPLRVHIEGDRMFVLGMLGEATGVPVGSELLEIQGVPVSALLQMIYQSIPAEGYTSASKAPRVALAFPLFYALLVDETLAKYEVRFRSPDGEEDTVVLEGILGKAAFDAARPHTDEEPLEVEVLEERGIGILKVRSLYERDLKGAGLDFVPFVEAFLTELKSKGIDRLVLDLRGNLRDSDEHGVALVAHLVDKPFRYFSYVTTAPTYPGNQDVATRSDGTQVLFPYAGMGAQAPAPEPFRGDLIVLIDGATFDTASDVAAVLHRLGRATFVGEETGGVYDGNTGGPSHKIKLPNSDMGSDLPTLDYELYGGDPNLFGLGVPPDHTVVWTGPDRLAGRDTAMEFVLGTLLKE